MQKRSIKLGKIEPIEFSISRNDVFNGSTADDSHIHDECEIYVNLSGDVSFMVEGKIYPVSRGSVIITRPYEYHHCIYNSNKNHDHIWILFSANGNENFLDLFFNREQGENNLIILSEKETLEMLDICKGLLADKTDQTESFLHFFRLISLLRGGANPPSSLSGTKADVAYALKYINDNLAKNINIAELAEKNHVSLNTLERHFKESIKTTPAEYIKSKRLAKAAVLLKSGQSVSSAAEKSGFSDYSHFISEFKKYFGMTPLKFKKNN